MTQDTKQIRDAVSTLLHKNIDELNFDIDSSTQFEIYINENLYPESDIKTFVEKTQYLPFENVSISFCVLL